MHPSSTDLTLTVAWVDQLGRVAESNGVESDSNPGSDKSYKEEKTGHICAGALSLDHLSISVAKINSSNAGIVVHQIRMAK